MAAANAVEEARERVLDAVDELTLGASRLEAEGGAGPAPEPLDLRHVVVASDGSPVSDHALQWGRALREDLGARVTVAHVMEPEAWVAYYSEAYGWQDAEDALGEREARGREALEHARAVVGGGDVGAELLSGFPADEVSRLAEERGAGLVVVGSHQEGAVERLLLGSVADAVRRRVHTSVLVAKGPPPARRVLVPVDGSRASKRAALSGLLLSRAWTAPATLLHVLPTGVRSPSEAAEARMEASLERLRSEEVAPGLSFERRRGQAAHGIVEAVEEGGYDLVVMGSRGLSGLRGAVLGSVSDRVSHGADASVLLVRDGGG